MGQADLKIRRFVYKIRERLREQSLIDYVLRLSVLGLFAALILSLISLFVPFYYAVLAAVGIVAFAVVLGIVLGFQRAPGPMEAALRADAKGYKEKISTAFFLAGREDSFGRLLKEEVLEIANRFSIRREFPLRVSWKHFLVMLLLAASFVATSMMSTPAREQARAYHAVKKDVKEEIAQLEKVEKAIAEQKEIPENELAETKEQLENAKKQLSEVKSREEMKKATDRIAKKMEQKSEQTENKTLSEALNQAAKDTKEREADREKELAKAAKEAMEQAAEGSRADKQKAYEKLSELAQSLDSAQLKQAAESYKESDFSDSDYAAAKSAMNQALDKAQENANAYANASNQNPNQNGTQNTQTSNQATVSSQSNPNSQNNNQSVTNAGQGQSGSGAQGQGENGNQGQGQSGSGNGGNNGSSNGGGWNYGSKNGKEGPAKTGEDITVPEGELGNDENLTGKANGNESSQMAESNQANTWSGNKVSYGQVSGKYKDKAYKKINGSNYPGKLKDKIRNYFEGLN